MIMCKNPAPKVLIWEWRTEKNKDLLAVTRLLFMHLFEYCNITYLGRSCIHFVSTLKWVHSYPWSTHSLKMFLNEPSCNDFLSMKTECDYLNGWIKKRSHTWKSHPKMVNPRDKAGERRRRSNDVLCYREGRRERRWMDQARVSAREK